LIILLKGFLGVALEIVARSFGPEGFGPWFGPRTCGIREVKIRDPMRGPLGIPDCPAQQELFRKALPPSLSAERWRTGADCMRDARLSRNV